MLEFRSLASTLRDEPEPRAVTLDIAPPPEGEPAHADPDESMLRDVRLFRAHLREALDRAVATLLTGIAREVLGRELLLANADIAHIVEAALERCEQPMRVRVHADCAAALERLGVPIFSDEALERGDAFLDLRNGSIDLSLPVRLEDALARALEHP